MFSHLKKIVLIVSLVSSSILFSQNFSVIKKLIVSDVEDFKKLEGKDYDYLEINSLNIDTLPSYVSNYNHLKRIEIINTPLKKIPTYFRDFNRLTYLKIENDSCITVEACINSISGNRNLRKLEIIQVKQDTSNLIIKNLPGLEHLVLREDHLTKFPVIDTSLSGLKILDLGYNDFTSINGINLSNLNLETLMLDHENQLRSIKGLNSIGTLKELHLEHTNVSIKNINIQGLERLYLDNNPNEDKINLRLNTLQYSKPIDISTGLIPLRKK